MNPPTPITTPNLVIKTLEYQGIKVGLKIDYELGEATIIGGDRQIKEYVFARQGLGQMDTWLKVLEALIVTVKEAKKELEWSLAESSKFSDISPKIYKKK